MHSIRCSVRALWGAGSGIGHVFLAELCVWAAGTWACCVSFRNNCYAKRKNGAMCNRTGPAVGQEVFPVSSSPQGEIEPCVTIVILYMFRRRKDRHTTTKTEILPCSRQLKVQICNQADRTTRLKSAQSKTPSRNSQQVPNSIFSATQYRNPAPGHRALIIRTSVTHSMNQ